MASVRKHPISGRWQVRYRSDDGRQRSKNFSTKRDADRFARETQVAVERGTWIDPEYGQVRFRDWVERWQSTRVNLRPSTVVRDDSYIRNLLLPTFGDIPLAAIHAVDVREWVAGLVAGGYAPATVRKAAQLLSAALEVAVDDGYLSHNPTRKLALPKLGESDMRFLTPGEVLAVAGAVDDRYRVLVLTAAYTGARWGELAGMKVDRLDLLRRTMTVAQQLTEVRGVVSLAPVKTSAARRTLSLPRFLADELAGHLATHPPADGLVFTSPEGGPLRRTNFRRRVWLPAVANSVGEPCRFHDLRHTAAALLIAQGEHPKVIQQRLGHRSIKTTLDTYGHLFDGLDQAAADRLDDVFATSHVDSVWTAPTNNVVPLPHK